MAEDKKRLQVYLASAGLGSRRSCEKLITSGRVTINGQPAMLGQSVFPDDKVLLDGKLVVPQERKRYILLYKPRGYLSSMNDPESRALAIDLLKSACPERVYNVGRLDQWSEGLLLFTNDGELALKMVHPSNNLEKEYEVETDKNLPPDFAQRFETGVEIDGVRYTAKAVSMTGARSARITLIEGKNREIRRVLEFFGLRALSLKRVRIGNLVIGSMTPGEYRELADAEIQNLQKSFRPARGGTIHDSGH